MTNPSHSEPFAAPYVLNPSSVTIQNGEEVWPASAPPPRPPRQRRWLMPVLVLGVLALIGGLVGAGVAEFQVIASRAGADSEDSGGQGGYAPPSSGDTAAPTPTAFSTTCDQGCLDVSSSGLMVPNNSLETSMPLSWLDTTPNFQHPTTAELEFRADAPNVHGDPACFFIGSRSPITPVLNGADADSADPVTFLGALGDDSRQSEMTQSARFFTSPAAASEYLSGLKNQVAACHAVDSSIASASGFALPPGVAVVTSVEKSPSTTTYVYDFQRANAVVRFRMVTSDSVDESAVRHFLGTWVTTDLAQLELN